MKTWLGGIGKIRTSLASRAKDLPRREVPLWLLLKAISTPSLRFNIGQRKDGTHAPRTCVYRCLNMPYFVCRERNRPISIMISSAKSVATVTVMLSRL